jgi:hypothetical protein
MFSYSVKDLVDILEDIYTYRHLNLVLSTDCRWIKHVNSPPAKGSEVVNDLGMLKCQLNKDVLELQLISYVWESLDN